MLGTLLNPADIKEEPESDDERAVLIAVASDDDSSEDVAEASPSANQDSGSSSESSNSDDEEVMTEPKIRMPRIEAPPVTAMSVEEIEGNLDVQPSKYGRVFFDDEEEDDDDGGARRGPVRKFDGGQHRRRTLNNARPGFGHRRKNAF
jgi:hypothetical protein